MNDIIKVCKIHGELTRQNIIKTGFRNKIQQYRCKMCAKELHKKNYIKNKEKINNKTKIYHKLNPEVKRTHNRKYNEKMKYERKEIRKLALIPTPRDKFSKTERMKRKLVYLLWDIDKEIRNANK